MDILFLGYLGKPAWSWVLFLGLVAALLAFDLGVLHRKPHEIGVRESLALSAFHICIGALFSVWTWQILGESAALLHLTGFVVEKSLALDNIFVIAMVFIYFGVQRAYQHRGMVCGILRVIVLRGLMIGVGAAVTRRQGALAQPPFCPTAGAPAAFQGQSQHIQPPRDRFPRSRSHIPRRRQLADRNRRLMDRRNRRVRHLVQPDPPARHLACDRLVSGKRSRPRDRPGGSCPCALRRRRRARNRQ